MDIMLGFMDKIYSDTKALSAVYIVGAVLLVIFIILLIFSLRKDKNKKNDLGMPETDKVGEKLLTVKDIENQNIEKTDKLSSKDITNKEDVEVNNEVNTKEDIEAINDNQSLIDATQRLSIKPLINNSEIETQKKEAAKEETPIEDKRDNNEIKDPKIIDKEEVKVSTDIPDVDEFVDKVVNKTLQKNEQFSSIYVEDKTKSEKLDQVLDSLNVDKDIKDDIVPKEEKSIEDNNTIVEEEHTEDNNAIVEEEHTEDSNTIDKLDLLKKSLEIKKEDISSKEQDLKSKLDNLKNNKTEVINKEDLLNKLNSLKK